MTDPLENLDLEDPVLPKAIRKAALTSGGYPCEEKIGHEQYDRELLEPPTRRALRQEHSRNTGVRILVPLEGRDETMIGTPDGKIAIDAPIFLGASRDL